MISKKNQLIANTVSALIFQVATILCGFILPRLILGAYGSEVNGLVNSILQFLGIISFLELGIGSVIQYSLYKPLANKDTDQISRVVVSGQKFFSKLATILAVYVVVLIMVYPVIAKQNFGFLYTATLIVVLSISSFAQYYFGIINRLLLTADQKGYISYNAQTVTLILNTMACFILIQVGAGIHLVKLITSLIYVLRPLALSIYVHKHYNIDWKIRYEGEPIKQKWNGIAQHLSAVVLDGTDSIVLTIFTSLKDVSIYSVYNNVTAGIKQLLLSMTNGIQSLLGELWAKQELDELKSFFSWVEWTLHTATTLIFGIASVLILPFIQVYTDGITDINYIQPLFASLIIAANAVSCLSIPYTIMILAGGHYRQTQSKYIIAAALNIIISILAVKSWGLVGVAIGTLTAMFYQTIWMAWYDSKNLICWPFKNFIKQMMVDILVIILIHFLTNVPFSRSFFHMREISYMAWVILAIKVSIGGCLVCLIMNFIFYRSHIKQVMLEIVKMFKIFVNILRK